MDYFICKVFFSRMSHQIGHVCTCVNRMVAGKQGTSRWSAKLVDIVVLQCDPRVSQGVYVGGRDLVGPVEPNVVPALCSTNYREDTGDQVLPWGRFINNVRMRVRLGV